MSAKFWPYHPFKWKDDRERREKERIDRELCNPLYVLVVSWIKSVVRCALTKIGSSKNVTHVMLGEERGKMA